MLKNEFGIKKGDRVVIYMPMIVESAIVMLACARVGAIHSVVIWWNLVQEAFEENKNNKNATKA